jgi:hypothetical protein
VSANNNKGDDEVGEEVLDDVIWIELPPDTLKG